MEGLIFGILRILLLTICLLIGYEPIAKFEKD